MPKATAVWLVENTSLTFQQIADFCDLHLLEIEAIADGEAENMVGFDPIASLQLTQDEIHRCESDPRARLQMIPVVDADRLIRSNKARYTPLIKRKNKPDAILWLVKYYNSLTNQEISSFLGTTAKTVQAIRDKTHPRYSELDPRSPVVLGFCTQAELDELIEHSLDVAKVRSGEMSLGEKMGERS